MYQYFFLNLLISLLLFSTVKLLKSAPARVKFRLLCAALFSWLIPYDFLKLWLGSYNIQTLSTKILGISQNLESTIKQQLPVDSNLSWQIIITVLCIIGFIIFLVDIWNLTKKKYRQNSYLYANKNGVNIYCKRNLKAAFIVGVFVPKIFIDESYKDQPQYNSIVTHELQHLKTNDHLWLLLISLVQRVLWWNPLVMILCKEVRHHIELACDEATAKQIGREDYQQDLSQLLINQSVSSSPILINNIYTKDKFSIFRIKQLSEEFNMNKNHKLTITTSLVILSGLLLFSFQSVSKTKPEEDKTFEEMQIKDNQAKIILDANIYVDDPKITINPNDKNANLEENYNSHKSFAANMIVNMDEHFSLKSSEIKGFEFDAIPTQLDDGSILFTTNINFNSSGKTITIHPSMHIKKHETGQIILNDDDGRYKLELNIAVR